MTCKFVEILQKTAAVATARKLCAVVWRVLSDKRPFVPSEEWDNRRAHQWGFATKGA